jgi:hypothetical protein
VLDLNPGMVGQRKSPARLRAVRRRHGRGRRRGGRRWGRRRPGNAGDDVRRHLHAFLAKDLSVPAPGCRLEARRGWGEEEGVVPIGLRLQVTLAEPPTDLAACKIRQQEHNR